MSKSSGHDMMNHLEEFMAWIKLWQSPLVSVGYKLIIRVFTICDLQTGLPAQNTTSSQLSHKMFDKSTKVPQKAYHCVADNCDESFTDLESLVRHEVNFIRKSPLISPLIFKK